MTHTNGAAEYWDTLFANDLRGPYSEIRPRIDEADPVYPALLEATHYFGDLHGKRLLDLGSGSGSFSLYFAQRGAEVVALDISSTATNRLTEYCRRNAITNVTPVCATAMDVAAIEPVDFISGSMILHHIEPFGDFVPALRAVLRGGDGPSSMRTAPRVTS
jgi:2-polyprenyl-3-methyl-5-hydroxy-6-metoxy-1,4-benzoquinol methylase